MKKIKIEKELSDSDIDDLFNNDNTSVLNNDNSIEIPEELSIENDKKSNFVDRPKNTQSENTRIKNEQKDIEKSINNNIEKDIHSVKKLTGFEQVRKYIRKLISLKNDQRINQEKTKAILAGLIKPNLDNGTECTFHIYKPRDILGDRIYCCCKFCSAEKTFSQSEWDEYCIKYRKWF